MSGTRNGVLGVKTVKKGVDGVFANELAGKLERGDFFDEVD